MLYTKKQRKEIEEAFGEIIDELVDIKVNAIAMRDGLHITLDKIYEDVKFIYDKLGYDLTTKQPIAKKNKVVKLKVKSKK